MKVLKLLQVHITFLGLAQSGPEGDQEYPYEYPSVMLGILANNCAMKQVG